jgi:hypothetical protein
MPISSFNPYTTSSNEFLNPFTPFRVKSFHFIACCKKIPINLVVGLLENQVLEGLPSILFL